MSDVQAPPAVAPAAPVTPPPPSPTTPLPNEVRAPASTAEATPPPAVADQGYVEQLRKENAAWRERTRAYEDRFGGLDGETTESLADFVRLLREGDSQAATDWLIESSRIMAGPQWPALVARYGQAGAAQVVAQAAAEETPANPLGQQQGPLTKEDLLSILDERERAAMEREEKRQTEQRVKQLSEQYNSELHGLQIHPDSELGRAIKMQAIQMTRDTGNLTSMTDALAALRQIAGQALGVALPASAPSPVAPAAGVPGQQADTRTPRQKMMDRLASAAQGGVAQQA